MAKLNTDGNDLLEQMRAAIAEAWQAQAPKAHLYDPLIEMAIYAASPTGLSPAQKFAANREIAQYIHAKRKSVEHSGDAGGLTILLARFTADGQQLIIEGDLTGAPRHAAIGHDEAAAQATVSEAVTAESQPAQHEDGGHS